jgi:hypothetical protein
VRFKLIADCEFEANGKEDAFSKLANHFVLLNKDAYEGGFIKEGTISLAPVSKEKNGSGSGEPEYDN